MEAVLRSKLIGVPIDFRYMSNENKDKVNELVEILDNQYTSFTDFINAVNIKDLSREQIDYLYSKLDSTKESGEISIVNN